jgi:TRAP-type mannitol/chloroaromatic compound transport system permease small subunit
MHGLFKALGFFVDSIDRFTERTGTRLAWLCLALAVITFTVVLLRYGLGIGSIAVQESATYLHAMVFMLGNAFTLKRDGHVRVDIFYRRMNSRQQAWVNSVGCIVFLLPICLFLVGISWHFVSEAWRIGEGSADPGGIHGVFLLKTLIPVMAVSLFLQGLAELARNTLVLVGER